MLFEPVLLMYNLSKFLKNTSKYSVVSWIPFCRFVYYSVICDDNMLEKINTDKTIKANFYSLVARMETLDKGMASEETYKNYLQDLYWYNSGMFRKLNRVYALVEKAVMQIYFIFLCHSLLRIKRQIQFFFKQWQPLCCDS